MSLKNTDHRLVRGSLLSYTGDPYVIGDSARVFIDDGAVLLAEGKIKAAGTYADLKNVYPQVQVDDHAGQYILPGFIDTHIHYPQAQVIASYGAQLLEWLNTYTFPAEAQFSSESHASAIAEAFIDELIRNGTTTAAAYATVHPQSVNALFTAAFDRNMRLGTGKVMMDRNAPDDLLDTAQQSYDESAALIAKWRGKGRLKYLVTPRFAITSTEAQLEAAGALLTENPDVLLQTHLSENQDEIDFVKRLFPASKDYLDVYDRFGLVGERSLFGHCIHLTDRERARMAESLSVAVFCPTSNLFIGSGLFDRDRLSEPPSVRLALATDVGGGTSYSMLQTAAEAYKILQLQKQNLTADQAFYWMTAGNAAAMGWESCLGRLEAGFDADLVVLNPEATSAMALRRAASEGSVEEDLFLLMTMGDDRAVTETYVAGEPLKSRLR